MPTELHIFRRLVLGLQLRASDISMQYAAELAGLLRLDLVGLFFEDTSLKHLAAIPFAREIRPLGGDWHPIDIDRLARDIDAVAHGIERIFTDAAKRLATRHQFEIVRGPLAETLLSMSRSDDIVMIVEPLSAAERATQQFVGLMQAAFRSRAAVLIVPPRIVRNKGPVVAIATGADDPSIRAAAAIASAAGEALAVVDIGATMTDETRLQALAGEVGVTITHIKAGAAGRARPAETLAPLRERLVVVTRDVVADQAAAALASARRVPVLVIEPPATAAAPAAA